MLHLTLRQVEIFCAVAQSGSTVAAAQAVSLSQSATSAALQQLERALGSQLFERVGRQLVLNDAGRALLPQALGLLEQARAIEQAFVVQGCGLPVRLRLAASTTIGSYVLPPVLAALARSHPQVAVDLQIANTAEVAEAVLALEVDLALIEGASHWPGLEVQPWLRDELVIVSAPHDPLARQAAGQPLASDALRSARWLLREAGSGTREMVEHALLPHLHQLHAAATLGSSEAIARCVAQGLGISCLPRVLVQPLVDAGELVVLPTLLPQMQRYFSLVQRAGKRRSPALQAFVDACRAIAPPSTD
ncbi:LysR family transcriptional regulator [Comamonas terrigena]|uniref:LysR family transcriptional regulator n=1 Tax=Comamonas terrigena TaxID=32013 RepID=A0A2A7USQ1_COMTR|nr:LysR family transcriptional regulator [Comamonas terrigena]PEH88191.1 LysR family transcriptional regulator [Comamonas terrigena]BBL23135.1 LysR family transcriptional regulator [Comamonas terrigena NBRC 13299]SUY87332.1 CysJI operon transcriptional activator [Comamonas terrigena]